MEKVKNFFRKVGTFCKNTALKVGSFCKSTFLKIKGWAVVHKVAAIAIAAGSVVAITLAIVLPVSISAANRKKAQQEPKEPEHVHVFANEWSKNSETHWHAATCGHDVKGDEAAHTFGAWTIVSEEKEQRTCSVCGYVAEQDHVHTYSTEWVHDETNHYHESTCGHNTTSGEAAHTFNEWHVYSEDSSKDSRECTVCGAQEIRNHKHNKVVNKFVWQEIPEGYWADAFYSCSIKEDSSGNSPATVTEIERVDATATADGHVKYRASYYSVDVAEASEEKEFVLHRPDEHGFCLNCGEYAGETIDDCEQFGNCMRYLGQPHIGSKLYFRCDLLGGHSLYLNDGDGSLASELTGYVKNGDVFTTAALDEEATIYPGEDGYVYIVFEASFDRTNDDFLGFIRDHTYNVYGLCLSDYHYSGKTYQVGTQFEINTTEATNKKNAYFRFPIQENHHYYIELAENGTDQLDYDLAHPGQSGQAYLAVNHTMQEVLYAEDAVIDEDNGYEPELIEIGEEIGDGYLYWRLSTDNAAGMTVQATIKDDHYEYDELETCVGEVYIASLDEEILLGEDNGEGHRIMGSDDTKLFRIKSGIAPGHKYYINANGFTPEIVNLYFWNRSNATLEPFNPSWREGIHKEYFEAPSADYSHGTVYIKVSPVEALTDASIEINFEDHPAGLTCLDAEHGVCSYLYDKYPFETFTLNDPASSFDLDTDYYFRISKESFRDTKFIHIFCIELNLHGGAQVRGYYIEAATGTWKQLGEAPAFISNNDDNWFFTYESAAHLNSVIDAAEGDYFFMKIHNLGSPVSNITSFTVSNDI